MPEETAPSKPRVAEGKGAFLLIGLSITLKKTQDYFN